MAYELRHRGETVIQTQDVSDCLVMIHKLRYAGHELNDMELLSCYFEDRSLIAGDEDTFEWMWPSLKPHYIVPIKGKIEKEARCLSEIDEQIRRRRLSYEGCLSIEYTEFKWGKNDEYYYNIEFVADGHGTFGTLTPHAGLWVIKWQHDPEHPQPTGVFLTMEDLDFIQFVWKTVEEVGRE